MNIGTTPHFLQSKRYQTLGWNTALGELVDNSFDAEAFRVEIDLSKRNSLIVTDDGLGCDDICRMLKQGDHQKRPGQKSRLGRYGVGLKDAGCWLWGELHIDSVCNNKLITAVVNWDRLSKQDDWEIADPITGEPPESFHQGMRLRFAKHVRNRPPLDKLASELGYIFWPGLTEGRQIIIVGPRKKRIVCTAWSPPPLTDIIEDHFHVSGKPVSLKAGIVPADDTNSRFGFNFAYGHRNIVQSSLGSNGHSVSRMCGVVLLGEGWTLSTNKTDICDDQEELGAALWERCREIIEKSEEQCESIFNRELESEVSKALQDYLSANKREKRDKGDSEGTVEPKQTERKRRRASKTQNCPGSIQELINAGAVRMEWREREDLLLGHVDLPGNRVYLNSSHPRLTTHRDNNNRDALVDCCLTMLTAEAFDKHERSKFPFARDNETVLEALSQVTLGTVAPTDNAMQS